MTMSRSEAGTLGRSLVFAALCALGVLLLQWSHTTTGRLAPGQAQPVLPRAEVARRLTFGFTNVLADWYWLQFVQYFGDTQARSGGYDLSADYLELIGTLNPHFIHAQAQANYAVAEAMADPERALRILLDGAARNPNRPGTLGMPGTWYLYRLAGSVVFRHYQDYGRAAQLYALAAGQPDAPAVMKENAAAFYGAANDRTRAIQLWLEFYCEAPFPQMRSNARERLGKLGIRGDEAARACPISQ